MIFGTEGLISKLILNRNFLDLFIYLFSKTVSNITFNKQNIILGPEMKRWAPLSLGPAAPLKPKVKSLFKDLSIFAAIHM